MNLDPILAADKLLAQALSCHQQTLTLRLLDASQLRR
jgi:hypothetical protein